MLDEVKILIVADHETTAATINWIWYFLSKHEDLLIKVREEAVSLDGNPPSFEALENLSFTRQVIDEALRMYPPVWVLSREVIKVVELGSYTLDAGTNIFISPYYIHRHPEYWQHADQFDPQRFSKENAKQIN